MFNNIQKHYNNFMQLFATATSKKNKIKSINQIYPLGESTIKYTQKSLVEVAIIFLNVNARK